MTHTPGPWAYHKWGKASGVRFGLETADHRHGLGSIEPNGNASTLLTIEQHEANAKLMAAAPTLFDSLKELLRALDDGLADHDWDPDGELTKRCYQALVKATV